jgi:hypothetical protein
VGIESALAQEIGHFVHDHANFVDPPQFKTKAEAKTTIFDFEFIEVWYNRQKLHSPLGYQGSAKFEQSFRH